jgi:hypothetical protein
MPRRLGGGIAEVRVSQRDVVFLGCFTHRAFYGACLPSKLDVTIPMTITTETRAFMLYPDTEANCVLLPSFPVFLKQKYEIWKRDI